MSLQARSSMAVCVLVELVKARPSYAVVEVQHGHVRRAQIERARRNGSHHTDVDRVVVLMLS
jgi:hypothetical protein